jgi:hypothetical protein
MPNYTGVSLPEQMVPELLLKLGYEKEKNNVRIILKH